MYICLYHSGENFIYAYCHYEHKNMATEENRQGYRQSICKPQKLGIIRFLHYVGCIAILSACVILCNNNMEVFHAMLT